MSDTLLRLIRGDGGGGAASAADVSRFTALMAELRAEAEAEYCDRLAEAAAARQAAEREAAEAKEKLASAEARWSEERRQLETRANVADAARMQAEGREALAKAAQQDATARATRLQGKLDTEIARRRDAEMGRERVDTVSGQTAPPQAYEFDIERDRRGLMTKIVARPV